MNWVVAGEKITCRLMQPVVVEKSASVAGSRVAQRLLHEAYRFQAIRPASSADVNELFPGNHRVKASRMKVSLLSLLLLLLLL